MAGFWQRLMRGMSRFFHSPEWLTFAGADFARHIMDCPVTDRFHAKQGRSTGRLLLHNNGQTLAVYLKRHYQFPWWQRLMATIQPFSGQAAAFTEWHNLQWAQAHGIPVPQPVAAGEWIGPWLRLQSFLAIEELQGMIPLHEAVPMAEGHLSPPQFRIWKQALTKELARLAGLLHGANRYHKDFYLCHFFLDEKQIRSIRDGRHARFEGQIYLIDLHRLAHHSWTGGRWQVKDLAQLLYSSDIGGIDDRDRVRFLKHYLHQGKLDQADRRLLSRVVHKAGSYQHHNAKNLIVSKPVNVPIAVTTNN